MSKGHVTNSVVFGICGIATVVISRWIYAYKLVWGDIDGGLLGANFVFWGGVIYFSFAVVDASLVVFLFGWFLRDESVPKCIMFSFVGLALGFLLVFGTEFLRNVSVHGHELPHLSMITVVVN